MRWNDIQCVYRKFLSGVGMKCIVLYGNSMLLWQYWELQDRYQETALATVCLGAIQHVPEMIFKRMIICLVSVVNALYSHTLHSYQWVWQELPINVLNNYHLYFIKIPSHFDLYNQQMYKKLPLMYMYILLKYVTLPWDHHRVGRLYK